MRGVSVEWWGRGLDYAATLERQKARRSAVMAGEGTEVLAMLEHRSVITTGKRWPPGLASPDAIAERGVDFQRSSRGGLATWHGPGQLVGYLIVDLQRLGLSVRCAVAGIEEGLIDWVAAQGVPAHRRAGHPGVWVTGGKLAAIGLHIRRGVSIHGFALNLRTQAAPWDLLVPCGIRDAGPISLDRLIEAPPSSPRIAEEVALSVLRGLASRSRLDAIRGSA